MTVSWFHARTGRLPLGRSALGGLLVARLGLAASPSLADELAEAPNATPTQEAADAGTTREEPEPPARPLLWLVDGPARIWIYGTLHTNDPRVLARPAAVDLAFRQSDGFFAETDLDCDMLADLMKVAALPEGETLSALLAPTLRKRLVEHLDVMGQSLATYEALEPWVLWFTLQAAVQGEACGEGMPLDWRLFQQAKRTGKTIGGLESPTEQFAPFDAMTREQQVHLVERSLDQLEQAEDEGGEPITPLERITRAWLAGDEEAVRALTQHVSGEGDELDAELAARLLDIRNERIALRMAAIARVSRGRALFMAVGAAHMAGPKGLLALLEAYGFQVRRITDVAEVRALAPMPQPARPCPPCPPQPCRPRPRPRCGPLGLPLPPFFR